MPMKLDYFNPEELIDVAEELIKNPSEPNIRTVLNRCYYSCYLTIKKDKNKIDTLPTYPHSQAHKAALAKGSGLNSLYTHLRIRRIAADYGLSAYQTGKIAEFNDNNHTVNIDEKTGNKAIRKAKKFIKGYLNNF